ncbi:CIA30 family protein [Haliea sp. E17]|uniref:CIA30 family protein n=1 Tax=Haliea sp. E17 TaxID=3401576 RepID=UPI003AAD16B9
MKHLKLHLAVLALFQAGQLAAAELAITRATIFPATGEMPYSGTVVIDEGLISAINRDGSYPANTPVLDAENLSLLPGFFDLHTHFTPRGYPATLPQIAQAYVASGVTTVLDFHQAPEAFAPRREWQESVPAPHIRMVARTSTTGGHGADWSDTTTTKWVDTPYAATKAIDELVPYQPDAIKAFTDGWRYGSGVDNTSMNEPTLAALVAEAHANGMPVLSHTVTVERAGIAARAGVDVIAHSLLDRPLDEATIADMAAAKTSYAPTLAVYEPEKPGRDVPPEVMEKLRERFQVGLDNVKTLSDAGVNVALGTDAGMIGTPHGASTLREMELLVRAGLSPAQALQAGTRNSALALGVLDQRGTIEVGKAADLVLVDGEPWKEIGAVRNTVYTFVDGRKVFGPGAPAAVTATVMEPAPAATLIDDFERADGRTSLDTLRTGAPDGGLERSWQIIQTLPKVDGGKVLLLTGELASREQAQIGVVLPLSQGSVQPVDASAFEGLSFELRGDGGPYLLSVTTTAGNWTSPLQADSEWRSVKVPFSALQPLDPAQSPWSSAALIDVGFLIQRPGSNQETWLGLDNVAFY